MKEVVGKIISNQTIALKENHSFFFCDLRGTKIILNANQLQIVGCIIDGLCLDIEKEKSNVVMELNLNLDLDDETKIIQKHIATNTINIQRPIISEELLQLFKKVLTVENYYKGRDNERLINYIIEKQCFENVPLLGICFLYAGKEWEVKTQIIQCLYEEDKFRNRVYAYKHDLLKRSYMLLFDEEYIVRDFTAHLILDLNPEAEELKLNDKNYILGIKAKYLFDGLAMLDKSYYQYIEDTILLNGLKSDDSDTVINSIKIMNAIAVFRFWDRLVAYIKNKEYEKLGDTYIYVLYKILSVFRDSDYYEEDFSFYELLLSFEDEHIQEDTLYLAYKADYENTDLIKGFIEKNKDKKMVQRFLEDIKEE
ncbi:hypothetical protein [Flavobacterium cerinum]|uniref:Uncharacterized protein n=1 Tax=Flavobacterium cerinum TaxID=2502784 RepID=A0ABY5IXW9_9FLAO|nr:hypothetical protein [Flavobacterium cerinum]UUC47306.1 hypothetical protein NOX80_08930 [Flavobacterium cerinum]